MECILQGHQADARADGQPPVVEIIGLHRYGTGAKADNIAEGAHKGILDAFPQAEMRDAAADDQPAGYTLQHRVADAEQQHQHHLPP